MRITADPAKGTVALEFDDAAEIARHIANLANMIACEKTRYTMSPAPKRTSRRYEEAPQ